ncbi:hypothetical protein UA08_07906 [Talaromyces atroroseus]|uniref:Uncharacterized protein n=1 Tax=Talaromyces atroroseus TaxID=1441469 RepID=A0A225AI26_TALAT|nr:hypothetical protein UA08_07906 [Talaromyces atroroseus]OKL56758.1 hypothetical protein UA08_07906 [Talaromyces atroroseus]
MPPTRRNLFQSHLSRRPASSASNSASSNNSIPPPLPADPNNNNNNHSLPETPSLAHHVHPSDIASSSLSTYRAAAGGTSTPPIDDGEIIARDKNGKFQLDIPVLPPLPLDEDDEDEEGEEDMNGNGGGGAMEGIEDGRPSAGSGGSGSNNAGGGMSSELVGRDKEKLEAGLVEMMYRNRNRHLSGEPEILNLIQQSLRSKVAALDEDKWMFEVEDDPLV